MVNDDTHDRLADSGSNFNSDGSGRFLSEPVIERSPDKG